MRQSHSLYWADGQAAVPNVFTPRYTFFFFFFFSLEKRMNEKSSERDRGHVRFRRIKIKIYQIEREGEREGVEKRREAGMAGREKGKESGIETFIHVCMQKAMIVHRVYRYIYIIYMYIENTNTSKTPIIATDSAQRGTVCVEMPESFDYGLYRNKRTASIYSNV